MTSKLRALALAAAFSGVASVASAVVIDPFDTPLSAGDNTNGGATAAAFEDFGMTSLAFTAADPLRATVSFTINPFLTDLSGTPANSISLAYSVNGGAAVDLSIIVVPIPPAGSIGSGGMAIDLAAGDTLSFIVDGVAGQSGNLVTLVVETAAVPIAPAGALGLTGIVALAAARRARKKKA